MKQIIPQNYYAMLKYLKKRLITLQCIGLEIIQKQSYRNIIVNRDPNAKDTCINPTQLNTPYPIDFNKSKHNKWQAPGIGQSKLAFDKLLIDGKAPEYLDEKDIIILKNSWSNIYLNRNKAAHTEVINRNKAKIVRESLEKIIKSDLIYKLVNIRNQYKN